MLPFEPLEFALVEFAGESPEGERVRPLFGGCVLGDGDLLRGERPVVDTPAVRPGDAVLDGVEFGEHLDDLMVSEVGSVASFDYVIT